MMLEQGRKEVETAQRRSGAIVTIGSPLGPLRLRTEGPQDQAFRFDLFCLCRAPEWDQLPLAPEAGEALMRLQFEGQARSYGAAYPRARFDIVELAGSPVGRVVVDRPGDRITLVDLAILPEFRAQGAGTFILRALLDEAAAGPLPLRLTVAHGNDAALRLYRRLGFRQTRDDAGYRELVWRP